MKKGDMIGGYRIVSDPTNADGGKCVWAFAQKGGEAFFMKRFLEPKRPGPGGSAASRRIRLENCREFEERHNNVMKLLRPDASGAGNLVLATDFFHEGNTYYKVTERIDTSSLAKPHALPLKSRAVLLRTLATSLRLLHDIGVVHGDLKPANVLVQKRAGAAFHAAKLIDFDDSYLAGDPPPREEIAGDSLYGAPEWRRYVQGDESVAGRDLTGAVDVFALGLMTHRYLTGELPGFDHGRFGSPADAVNAGEPLVIEERLATGMQALIASMTARDPGVRPTVAAFLETLRDGELCALHTSPQPRPAVPAPEPDPVPPPDPAAPGPGEPRRSRVRGVWGPGRSPQPEAEPQPAPRPAPAPPSAASPPPAARKESRVRFTPRSTS